jgi:hypothetical protein
VVIVRFCWGFWQKRVVERGFLMVNLWWIRGELWLVDGHFSGAKNMPHFGNLFLAIPVLGIESIRL